MTTITLVTESKLYLKDNTALYDYFDDYSKLFNFLVRKCVHHLKNKLNGEKESQYRTNLMIKFCITNRMAKAIIRTAKNQLKLLSESARYQYNNLYKRRRSLFKKIQKLKVILSLSSVSLKQRKLAKLRLFWTQMKLNKANQLISNGLKLHLTFGTKHLLKTNKAKFLAKRDNQVVYIGDKNETCGNQQFQINFNSKCNRFEYKLRLDNQWVSGVDKYIFGSFVLKNKDAKVHILKTLSEKKSNPLTYRIIKRDNDLYLQIMYRRETFDITRNNYGVLGVDFNKGFISVSEINTDGKLQSLTRYNYLHQGKATKTKTSMLELVSKLVSQAVNVGKDIVIEDLVSLDSNKKQEKTTSKNYNRMINSLKFGLFKHCLVSKATKEGVSVHTVNPYNTSKIAKASYTDKMKLNVHDAASYVIARRFYQYN
jgi:transposase, IS605 orfB family